MDKTKMEKENTGDNQDRKRRSLGCAFWAIPLSMSWNILVLVVIGIIYEWQRGIETSQLKDWFEIFIFWLLITMVVALPLAFLIGYFTRTPKNKIDVFFASSIIFIGLSVFFTWFGSKICQLGDTGPRCPRLTEVPLVLLSAVIAGLLLGLLGAYGYWRAGRKQ